MREKAKEPSYDISSYQIWRVLQHLMLHEMKLNSQPQNLPYIIPEQLKNNQFVPSSVFPQIQQFSVVTL